MITNNIITESEASRESEAATAEHQDEINHQQNDQSKDDSHFPVFPHHLSLDLFWSVLEVQWQWDHGFSLSS